MHNNQPHHMRLYRYLASFLVRYVLCMKVAILTQVYTLKLYVRNSPCVSCAYLYRRKYLYLVRDGTTIDLVTL